MKHIGRLPFIWVLWLILSCHQKVDTKSGWHSTVPNSLEELQKSFKNPPIDFSTAPFWVWNDQVTQETIDFQLREFKDKGIHMVFVHPRPGLVTEYLGNEWFELVQYSVEKARELDMKIWLYDENSYPSGFAGGHVPAASFSNHDPVAGLNLKKLEMLTEKDTSNYFIILKKMGDGFANISNSRSKYFGKPGQYYCFTKWYYPKGRGWYGGFSYVDLLAYGITEKFIRLTMDGYEDYIGDEFGATVPGIFTDEPNINTSGAPATVVRFTPVLFNRFEKKYGYQLQTYLPCLYEEVGDWQNVRHDYQALLLEMFEERWGETWNRYCQENKLQWTGHYWEHGWPNPKHGPDNMAMYAYHQIPGIDMLFNTERRPDQFGNIRAVKELSSVANQLDRARALSETYGGSGWELTFDDMKRQGDWEYVLGVNMMNQHLSHMTLKGARKRDYPQSMSYHAPWWDNYKPLNAYFHRLSFALTAGKQKNDIIIIEPTSTSWMYYGATTEQGQVSQDAARTLKASFDDLLTRLEKEQVEYDLGSESIIRRHGSVQANQFVVGSRSYRLVVLPPNTKNLLGSTFQLLTAFLQNGGTVLSISEVPTRLNGNQSKAIVELSTKYSDQWIMLDEVDDEAIARYLRTRDFQPIDPKNWGGNVFHQRRMLKDGQLFFFTNYHKEEGAKVQFKGKGRSVLVFDAMSGDSHLMKFDKDVKLGMLTVSLKLPPSGSKLLVFSESRISTGENMQRPAFTTKIASAPTVVRRLQANTITLDYCDVRVGGRLHEDLYFYAAADSVFKAHLGEVYGYNYNPWSNAVQYRTRILDKNQFDSSTGFDAFYHFFVDEGLTQSTIMAAVESPGLYEVRINGAKVTAEPQAWWLDRDFGTYKLGEYVKVGKNTLSVHASPMDILAEIEPVYLIGNFGVEAAGKGWKLVPEKELAIGSWKGQAMPFYSHGVSYSKVISRPESGRLLLRLNEWAGTLAEVKVNGVSAGIIGWKPYELDISKYLKSGENEVEVIVTGSLKNLMGPHHLKPERGFVTPWSFFRAPIHQPAGTAYDMLDYGLFEDFEVRAD
jgi:hypothetical protein